MKIAIDAMGGDYAPQKIVEGAILAAQERQVSIVLVGKEDQIRAELNKYSISNLPLSVQPASDVIGMSESPSKASRQKKDSSIVVATQLQARGEVDAVISAGNSGAVMTSALRYLGRIHGVYRPAIATLIPTLKGHCIVADVGANTECKPIFLLQFAIMAKHAARSILEIENPTVGLLSNGEEREKGNHLTKHTFPILEACTAINFIGNVEGRDITKGTSDIVVCDGFVGNVVLKTIEGTANSIGRMIKSEISSSFLAKSGYFLIRPAFKKFRKRVDYAEYGGAPLLGVNGVCIICHGKSSAKAIKNAVRVAEHFVQNKVNEKIKSEIQEISRVQRPETNRNGHEPFSNPKTDSD